MRQSEFLRAALVAITDAGWRITHLEIDVVTTVNDAMDLADALDMGRIRFESEGRAAGLLFVWQGPDADYEAGEEIIADYDTRFESILERLYQAAES